MSLKRDHLRNGGMVLLSELAVWFAPCVFNSGLFQEMNRNYMAAVLGSETIYSLG
jgi:hypothetical protein